MDTTDFPKRLQKYIKYSIVIKIEKHKIININVMNGNEIRFKTQWVKRNLTFDKITLGNGMGITYDFIIYLIIYLFNLFI